MYKHSFILLPVAATAICQPAYATVYLSIEQAQALMFPQQSLTALRINPSAADIATLERESGVHYYPGADQYKVQAILVGGTSFSL